MTARQGASALLKFFSQVGIPKEVMTDQGPNFMSRTLSQAYQLLGIRRVRTTPYPQTDGLVERFNQILKGMLRKFVSGTGKDWDRWLPFLLFAYREVPTGLNGLFTFRAALCPPGQRPHEVPREMWEGPVKSQDMNIVSYVPEMQEQLMKSTEIARQNLLQAQAKQKEWYNRSARYLTFEPGQTENGSCDIPDPYA